MRFRMVAGALVTEVEYAILEELLLGQDTAQSLAVNIGLDGWSTLRRLTSLEMRRLVERFEHCSGVLAWRLPAAVSAELRAAA